MQVASQAIVLLFTALLGLWPVVFAVVLIRHSLGRRWRLVGQVALLIPVWTIAASIGLTQVLPFFAALGAQRQARSPFIAVIAIGITLFFAVVAWGLLARSFGAGPQPGADREGAA